MRTRAEQRAAGPERAEARFERLYAEHGRAVLAYAVRRASDAQDAADVVAETFLVAWRRLEEMPSAEATRPWLYGVARHVLANQQRSERRRLRLAERLRRELPVALQGVAPLPPETGAVRAAVAQLGPEDQEILLRTALQELPEPEDPDLLRLQEAR